jgi:hypothetical protein
LTVPVAKTEPFFLFLRVGSDHQTLFRPKG